MNTVTIVIPQWAAVAWIVLTGLSVLTTIVAKILTWVVKTLNS